jgi:hypothetical protein
MEDKVSHNYFIIFEIWATVSYVSLRRRKGHDSRMHPSYSFMSDTNALNRADTLWSWK